MSAELRYSAGRVWAMLLRYLYLLRSSWPRTLELLYWPTLQMLIWGFMSQFLYVNSNYVFRAFGVLLAAVMLWDVLFRGQLGLSISFLEEMWARNLGHLFVTPLRPGGQLDPHAWQAVPNAKIYVTNIRDALISADPADKAVFEANAAAYLQRLDALNTEFKAEIAKIPPDRRELISIHDAFGYLGSVYGIAFVAPHGVSTEAEGSARDIAHIIKQIRAEHIPAVFLENVTDPRVMEQIAHESGARVGGTLYSDALTAPDGPAPTYIDLMRHNLKQLVTALAP